MQEKLEIDSSIYWNINDLLSYNSLIYFVVGERGVGKSYGCKKYVANHFLKTGKQFVYIRRYKTELKEALSKQGTPIFWEQIKKDFPKVNFSNKTDTLYINDEIAGYAIPLSIANILKSSSYENVDTIIFDEFIIDKGCYHYLHDEVTAVLELIETISRLRDVKIIFLGNAISITNPYFSYFNITLPYNSNFKVIKKDKNGNPLIVINYIKNLKYRNVKKSTRFGQLIENTEYGKYAIDNEFLRDSKSFVGKKSKDSKFFFTLFINNNKYGVWIDYKQEIMFISQNYDPNYSYTFSILPDDHNESTLLIKIRNSPLFQSIISHYRIGKLFFENQQIKNTILNTLHKYIT